MGHTAGSRVLVTGATGFVGSHIASLFVAEGYRVRVTVRATSDRRWLEGLAIETVEAELEDDAALAPVVKDVETIVHAAGLTRARHRGELRRGNVDATARLAEAAIGAGVGCFVFVGSLAARGPDPDGGPTGPVSAYGRSKRKAEEELLARADRLRVVLLRPSGVYGPRDSDLLPLFRMADRGFIVAPRGSVRVQPVYVQDVARAALAAATSASTPGPWPVAEVRAYSWPEVAAALGTAVGRRARVVRVPPVLFDAAGALSERAAWAFGRRPALDRRRARDLSRHSYTCDVRPTEEALGWKPEVKLEKGLARTASWYRKIGWMRAS